MTYYFSIEVVIKIIMYVPSEKALDRFSCAAPGLGIVMAYKWGQGRGLGLYWSTKNVSETGIIDYSQILYKLKPNIADIFPDELECVQVII